MKLKYVVRVVIITIFIAISVGLYCKNSYRDFNEEENALDNFVVALIDDEYLEWQFQVMEENLKESNMIVAVQCEDTFTYRYSCVTQPVRIVNVFKGEGISEGDTIEIARGTTLLSIDKEAQIDGKYVNNMGFVNEMIPGKTYLVFLDRKLNTFDEKLKVYIQSDEYLLAPIFCYEEIINTAKSPSDEYSTYVEYEKVRDNEFFIMSEDSSEKIKKMKEKLFQEYNIEGT